MKKITLFLVYYLIFISGSVAQEKEIIKAISNNPNDLYVTVVLKKPYDKSKVEKTCRKLGYLVYGSEKQYYSKYGKEALAYKSIKIAKPNQVLAYNQRLAEREKYLAEQQKIKNKKKLERMAEIATGIAVLGTVVVEGLKNLAPSNSHNPSSSNSNSTQPRIEKNKKLDCNYELIPTGNYESTGDKKSEYHKVKCNGDLAKKGGLDIKIYKRTEYSIMHGQAGFIDE